MLFIVMNGTLDQEIAAVLLNSYFTGVFTQHDLSNIPTFETKLFM